MSITSELVDKYDLFREGLAQDSSQIRKCVIEFFGANNSEIKRLNVKVFGDTSVYVISKNDGSCNHTFEIDVTNDKLQFFTIRTESWTRTWNQDTVCNALGWVPTNKDIRNLMFDIFEAIK